VVAGLSMGGFGALSYAAPEPGMPRAVASYGGVSTAMASRFEISTRVSSWLVSVRSMALQASKCFLGVHAAWSSSSLMVGCWSGAKGLPIWDSTWLG
jgi:S-formylglutathione hydrolase FrmB